MARLHDLEQRFDALFAKLPQSSEKAALSVLHGMMQELWRQVHREAPAPALRGAGSIATGTSATLDDIAELYRHAPKMEGARLSTPLAPGTRAPDFTLPDPSAHLVRLSEYRGINVVLVFYPLDWSPGCSQQLDLYQLELEEFRRRDAAVLGISVDSMYSHGAWAAVRGITFPLLSDFHPRGDVARRYQVYRDQDGFSDRALYVVDAEGTIRYSHVSPFLHHVPDIYELLGALDSVQMQHAAETARATGVPS
jgi:peroxiredoxin